MKVRKKPVVVDAWRWDESMATLKMTGCAASYSGHRDRPDECTSLSISTLEGTMRVSPGDWIIKGVKGEFYPCKPDIFEATYDPVEPTVSEKLPTIEELRAVLARARGEGEKP